MNDTIICPHCKKSFPVTEALKHQIEDEVKSKFEKEQKMIMWKKALAAAESKKNEETSQEIKLLKTELDEKNKKMDQFIKNEMEIRKEKMKLEEEKKEVELKIQRTLDEERKKIETDAFRRAVEENKFKDLEYKKKEVDLLKQIEELKQKATQGSQQTQGEVLELELENILQKEFPADEIKEVPKGVRGADIVQVVKSQFGKTGGTIIWESKRTKSWSNDWIPKLRNDQQAVNAEVAVLVSHILPDNIKHFGLCQGVWVCSYEAFLGLTMILRDSLIKIAAVKSSVIGKDSKQEILWNYLTGMEFKSRIDAIYDAYGQLQDDLERERKFYTQKWARQEKSIRRVIDNILGMNGDLQSIVGKALPEIKGVVLPDENVVEKSPLLE